MGRVQFSGKDAQAFLSKVLTRKIDDQKVGAALPHEIEKAFA